MELLDPMGKAGARRETRTCVSPAAAGRAPAVLGGGGGERGVRGVGKKDLPERCSEGGKRENRGKAEFGGAENRPTCPVEEWPQGKGREGEGIRSADREAKGGADPLANHSEIEKKRTSWPRESGGKSALHGNHRRHLFPSAVRKEPTWPKKRGKKRNMGTWSADSDSSETETRGTSLSPPWARGSFRKGKRGKGRPLLRTGVAHLLRPAGPG